MTVEAAYQFLKPTLDQFSEKEKNALSQLISGQQVEPKKRKKKIDLVPSRAEYRRKLVKWFESKKETPVSEEY